MCKDDAFILARGTLGKRILTKGIGDRRGCGFFLELIKRLKRRITRNSWQVLRGPALAPLPSRKNFLFLSMIQSWRVLEIGISKLSKGVIGAQARVREKSPRPLPRFSNYSLK